MVYPGHGTGAKVPDDESCVGTSSFDEAPKTVFSSREGVAGHKNGSNAGRYA